MNKAMSQMHDGLVALSMCFLDDLKIAFTGASIKVTTPKPIEDIPNVKDLSLHILNSSEWNREDPLTWSFSTLHG